MMNRFLKGAIVAFLVINALFWGLFPHSVHCQFVKMMGMANCPSHIIHVTGAMLSFIIAVLIQQWGFWDPSTWQ